MALRRRAPTATTSHEDASSSSSQDSSIAFHRVGSGIRDIAQLTNSVILEFQGVVKSILPLFSAEHQRQIREILNDYHRLLIQSQRFLTRALILTGRAQTSADLIQSINVKLVEEMIETVIRLLERFRDLDPIVKEKLRDHKALVRWRNIFGLMTGTGLAACAMGGIGGLIYGFTRSLNVFLVTAGSVTTATACATSTFHMAHRVSDLNLIIEDLKTICTDLTQLSQNYTIMSTYIPLLSDSDGTKEDFIRLLKETQTVVNKGFELLKNL